MNSDYPSGFNTYFQNFRPYQHFPPNQQPQFTHIPHNPQFTHIPHNQHHYYYNNDNNHNNGIYNEFRELKKHIDTLTDEINKLKSIIDLQQTNSVISNDFIDKTVDKLKSVDTRLNYAFTKIKKIENNNNNSNNIKLNNNKRPHNIDNIDNIDNNDNNIINNTSEKNTMTIPIVRIISNPNGSKNMNNNIIKNPITSTPLNKSSGLFPLSSLFSMINSQNENEKKPETNDLIDSEDDYDMNSEIYAEPDILKIDNDILEVKLDIKSIDDLIDIGIKFKNELNINTNKNSEKNSEKKEKEKDKKEKKVKKIKRDKQTRKKSIENDTDEDENDEDMPGLILFNNSIGSSKNSNNMPNDFTSLLHNVINEAFQEAIEKTEKDMEEFNKTENKETKEEKYPGYYMFNGKKYSVDINKIINLVEPLQKLKNIIGMHKIKDNILEMILYYIQNFESNTSDMLHTSIEGPPGVGKTKLGRILAQVYHGLGVIPSKRFKRVRRTDLIGKYLGHTAHKTQEVIDEAEGGVLFIDEAYSLGAEGEKDIYSKECIDTINMNLTEKKKNLIVIIAGYTDQLDKSFFAANEGLKRRFPFRFTIDGYNEKEMKDIFYAQIRRLNWKLHPELSIQYLEDFFKKNKKEFPHFGGDIETIILNCKMSHAKRVIGKPNIYHKILTIEDISNAFNKFKQNKKKEESIKHIQSMYT
jgi:hypothetical protein